MSYEKYSNTIEAALASLGLNPVESRCEEDGQWLIFNGETEIYIDIWEEKEQSSWLYFSTTEPVYIFQIISPICYMPAENHVHFYEDLLHNNLNLLHATYTINKDQNVVAIKVRKPVVELTSEQVVDLIECIGFYSESTFDILKERYPVERITKEN